MRDEIVKWISKNAEDLRIAVLSLVVINCIIIAMAGCMGELLFLFLHLLNILFADVAMILPTVFIVKFIRTAN